MRPLRLGKGQRVHQIGLPYNWGSTGHTTGDTAGQLVPLAMDPNVSIHEGKTLTCTIRPGRRAAYVRDEVAADVPPSQHTDPERRVGRARQRCECPMANGFFTDTTLCIGCKACEVACKQWNQLPADGYEFTGELVRQHDGAWRHDLAARGVRRAGRTAPRRRRARPSG